MTCIATHNKVSDALLEYQREVETRRAMDPDEAMRDEWYIALMLQTWLRMQADTHSPCDEATHGPLTHPPSDLSSMRGDVQERPPSTNVEEWRNSVLDPTSCIDMAERDAFSRLPEEVRSRGWEVFSALQDETYSWTEKFASMPKPQVATFLNNLDFWLPGMSTFFPRFPYSMSLNYLRCLSAQQARLEGADLPVDRKPTGGALDEEPCQQIGPGEHEVPPLYCDMFVPTTPPASNLASPTSHPLSPETLSPCQLSFTMSSGSSSSSGVLTPIEDSSLFIWDSHSSGENSLAQPAAEASSSKLSKAGPEDNSDADTMINTDTMWLPGVDTQYIEACIGALALNNSNFIYPTPRNGTFNKDSPQTDFESGLNAFYDELVVQSSDGPISHNDGGDLQPIETLAGAANQAVHADIPYGGPIVHSDYDASALDATVCNAENIAAPSNSPHSEELPAAPLKDGELDIPPVGVDCPLGIANLSAMTLHTSDPPSDNQSSGHIPIVEANEEEVAQPPSQRVAESSTHGNVEGGQTVDDALDITEPSGDHVAAVLVVPPTSEEVYLELPLGGDTLDKHCGLAPDLPLLTRSYIDVGVQCTLISAVHTEPALEVVSSSPDSISTAPVYSELEFDPAGLEIGASDHQDEPTPVGLPPFEFPPSEPTPSEPTPSEPTPSEPTPSEPTPSEPTPSDPTSTGSGTWESDSDDLIPPEPDETPIPVPSEPFLSTTILPPDVPVVQPITIPTNLFSQPIVSESQQPAEELSSSTTIPVLPVLDEPQESVEKAGASHTALQSKAEESPPDTAQESWYDALPSQQQRRRSNPFGTRFVSSPTVTMRTKYDSGWRRSSGLRAPDPPRKLNARESSLLSHEIAQKFGGSRFYCRPNRPWEFDERAEDKDSDNESNTSESSVDEVPSPRLPPSKQSPPSPLPIVKTEVHTKPSPVARAEIHHTPQQPSLINVAVTVLVCVALAYVWPGPPL